MNLFGKQYEYLPKVEEQLEDCSGISGNCSTIVGTFAWDMIADSPKITFQPGIDISHLGSFQCQLFGSLDFGQNSIQHYQNALELGISEWSLVLPGPDSSR